MFSEMLHKPHSFSIKQSKYHKVNSQKARAPLIKCEYDWARVSMTCFTQSESSQTSAVSGQIYAGTESSFYPTSPEKDTGRHKHSWESASLWMHVWHNFHFYWIKHFRYSVITLDPQLVVQRCSINVALFGLSYSCAPHVNRSCLKHIASLCNTAAHVHLL